MPRAALMRKEAGQAIEVVSLSQLIQRISEMIYACGQLPCFAPVDFGFPALGQRLTNC